MEVKISAKDVKKLRDITGAGMMDCKKALAESGGDHEGAIEYLRKKGQKLSAKEEVRAQLSIYSFELKCPYCDDEVILQRHSARAPQHCEKDSCADEHRRLLARTRKRRQRQRNKKSR